MLKSLTKPLVAAIALATALPVFAEDMTADTVVATVNGTDITLGHMLVVRAGLPDQYQQLPDDALWEGILDQIIQQEVLKQSDDAVETTRVRVAIDNERRSLLAAEAITAVANAAVTEDAIAAAYEAKYAGENSGMEFNASHILLETEDQAKEVLAAVKGGADFALTAKEQSTGPSGPNGGLLGWFSAGMMVEPFQVAVESLNPGDVTGPVQTQFGWHVIKLNETRVKEAPALEAVRAELEQEVQQIAVREHIDGLLTGSDITRKGIAEIDASVLSQVELLEE